MATIRYWLLILLFASSSSLAADALFVADKACAMYQSKRKKTNPGNLHTALAVNYLILDVFRDKKGRVTWYRVQTRAKHSAARWVSAGCGHLGSTQTSPGATLPSATGPKPVHARPQRVAPPLPKTQDKTSPPIKPRTHISVKPLARPKPVSPAKPKPRPVPRRVPVSSCPTRAGLQDSQILAVSWQSTWCESNPRARSCRNLDKNDTAARQFSLHGLWPNHRSCGKGYAYCGTVRQRPSGNFCSYPEVQLLPALRLRLANNMPGTAGCLERHEWWKHGSCSGDNATGYYHQSLVLLAELNRSDFLMNFIQPNIGKKVKKQALLKAFRNSFGKGSDRSLKLVCKGGKLAELRLQLPADFPAGHSLGKLLRAGETARGGSCKAFFEIDGV